MLPSPNLRCGPAGWAFPHWNGLVYPRPRPRGFHALEHLAQYFDVVEVNTEWRPELCRLWIRKVAHNPNFQFTVRLSRRFTHEREIGGQDVAAFKEGLWPLLKAGKLGCVVMQFPWSFRYTEENREFFIRLRHSFPDFPLAAELRHASWLSEEALGVLIDHKVAFVNIDQPAHTRATPPTALLTSPVGYVRLHGRDPRYWFEEFGAEICRRRPYFYSAGELREWKLRIETMRPHAASVIVVTTNDGGAASVVNAVELGKLLGVGGDAPAELVRRYAEELAGCTGLQPAQQSLLLKSWSELRLVG